MSCVHNTHTYLLIYNVGNSLIIIRWQCFVMFYSTYRCRYNSLPLGEFSMTISNSRNSPPRSPSGLPRCKFNLRSYHFRVVFFMIERWRICVCYKINGYNIWLLVSGAPRWLLFLLFLLRTLPVHVGKSLAVPIVVLTIF